jgi:zeaxanthin glucosyltransferase
MKRVLLRCERLQICEAAVSQGGSSRGGAASVHSSNAIIVNQAPQLEVLKRTSVCISHAGLNTVLESLAQGVPQVGIPITFDQPGVATRIAAKKTGVTMPFEKLTSDHLATLLGEVLNNDVYRENARKLQDVIAKTNGLSMAADLVEQSLGVTQKSGKF